MARIGCVAFDIGCAGQIYPPTGQQGSEARWHALQDPGVEPPSLPPLPPQARTIFHKCERMGTPTNRPPTCRHYSALCLAVCAASPGLETAAHEQRQSSTLPSLAQHNPCMFPLLAQHNPCMFLHGAAWRGALKLKCA